MLFTEHQFKLFFFLSTGQLLTSVVLSLFGTVVFPTTVQLRHFGSKKLLRILPLSLVNSLNAILGFAGLRLVNIPMFLVLRRITTPIVLIFEYVFMKKPASPLVKNAIAIAVVGTLVAGSTDLSFELFGYLYTFGNNLCTATYLILIKILGAKTGPDAMSSFELLFYNSCMSLPIMALLAYFNGEMDEFFEEFYPYELLILFSLSCVMGFVFNFVVFMCTSVNSPLATSVTGNIKDCLATLLGYVFFDDVYLELVNVLGILTSLVGGMVYSYAKLKESGSLGGSTLKTIKDSEEETQSLEFLGHIQRAREKERLIPYRKKEVNNVEK